VLDGGQLHVAAGTACLAEPLLRATAGLLEIDHHDGSLHGADVR